MKIHKLSDLRASQILEKMQKTHLQNAKMLRKLQIVNG